MPPTMRAMLLRSPGTPLEATVVPVPAPSTGEVLMRVLACGVCRTDLHIVDGELTEPSLPLIPGHQIVGEVVESPDGALEVGTRVGVPWLASTCGTCRFCTAGRENLCTEARFTGYHVNGGFAEMAVARVEACLQIPPGDDAIHAAPLLCAGLIGYRAYRMAGDGRHLGLYGFGAAAHMLVQLAVHDGRSVYAFTRPGDGTAQALALELGATWAGASESAPPAPLDAAIIFAPVGALVPAALAATAPGGTVVCAGIHMSDIPSFPYALLWGERTLRSVANLTRRDGAAFMARAADVHIHTTTTVFPLESANDALDTLRAGRLVGAAVLQPTGVPS
jgi:propanol-preferring alcohol dehydrogenase